MHAENNRKTKILDEKEYYPKVHALVPLSPRSMYRSQMVYLILFQEKDFEFMDNELDEPYSIDTLQDDEDYQAQQPGSGIGPTNGGFPGGTDIDPGSGEDDQDPATPPGKIHHTTGAIQNQSRGRVSTLSGNQGNQGKLEDIFPVREKSRNLAFFLKIKEKSGIFDHPIFFVYFILFLVYHGFAHYHVLFGITLTSQ